MLQLQPRALAAMFGEAATTQPDVLEYGDGYSRSSGATRPSAPPMS
jgi:hypothetical protein